MSAALTLFPWTERDVLNLLHQRYCQVVGNGPRYAIAEHVRSAAGFDARRTADCIVMDLWPSKGLAMHGHEIKVSRSDWLTELKDPDKAEAFKPYMDYWWLVVSDRAIVKDGELPADWGLLAPSASRAGLGYLQVVKQAKRLHPEPIPKTMVAALLRATAKTAQRGRRYV